MAAMFEVIPAIDLMDGKCVRLEQGRYTQRTVYGDPVDAARAFAGSGVRRLHVVDLDGARAGRPANLAVLEAIAAATELVIDFGGGINSEDDAAAAFSGGADILNIGSMAVRSPETFRYVLGRYREKVLLGADVRGTRLAICGWLEQTEV